jgi:hypothetical protein
VPLYAGVQNLKNLAERLHTRDVSDTLHQPGHEIQERLVDLSSGRGKRMRGFKFYVVKKNAYRMLDTIRQIILLFQQESEGKKTRCMKYHPNARRCKDLGSPDVWVTR